MAQGSRSARVGDLIRTELGELLTRTVKDPGIGFVTVTRVELTGDLQLARVYYTSLNDQQARRETARALERATPFLRRQIGQRLTLKRVPQLRFVFDKSLEHQDRIAHILEELNLNESNGGVPPDDGPD